MSYSNVPSIISNSISASQIDDPQTLSGLFPPDSDDEGECNEGDDDINTQSHNQNVYEIQTIELVGKTINIRQYDYHSHNANRIWPGTFPLAEYLLQERSTTSPLRVVSTTDRKYVHHWGRILELGTATGLLAIRLAMASSEMKHNSWGNYIDNDNTVDDNPNDDTCCCTSIVTSDVDDEYGDIAANLLCNYTLNHMTPPLPYHIPHTWGTGFRESKQKVIHKEIVNNAATDGGTIFETTTTTTTRTHSSDSISYHPLHLPFDTIIASDILLYVSSYPALVETLSELMIPSSSFSFPPPRSEEIDADVTDEATKMLQHLILPSPLPESATTTTPTPTIPPIKFIMSWNRRLKESKEFFMLMNNAGFTYEHHGKGIYTFVYENHNHRLQTKS